VLASRIGSEGCCPDGRGSVPALGWTQCPVRALPDSPLGLAHCKQRSMVERVWKTLERAEITYYSARPLSNFCYGDPSD